jgi:molybdopterin biosynthesis enzyme MoaB
MEIFKITNGMISGVKKQFRRVVVKVVVNVEVTVVVGRQTASVSRASSVHSLASSRPPVQDVVQKPQLSLLVPFLNFPAPQSRHVLSVLGVPSPVNSWPGGQVVRKFWQGVVFEATSEKSIPGLHGLHGPPVPGA